MNIKSACSLRKVGLNQAVTKVKQVSCLRRDNSDKRNHRFANKNDNFGY
jgi:hypothetical protein